MTDRITEFFESIKGRTVALFGIGITNAPLAEMFLQKGSRVIVCDRRTAEQLGDRAEQLQRLGAQLKLGDGYLNDIKADIIFRTPGMSFSTPELVQYRSKGAAVTSEMEIFMQLCPAKVIGVTGSCGKTTVCSIIADMLTRSGRKVWLGGNIGRPLLPEIENISPDDIAVCELSSLQLESMHCSPDIAVVTNISPNHLDRHSSMDEYVEAKRNIFLHQSAFGRAVFNADSPVPGRFAGDARGAVLTFSRRKQPEWGAYTDSRGGIWFNDRGNSRKIMNISEIRVAGMHNVENFLAAICAVDGIADDDAIRETAHLFCGVEHRAEFVRCIDGATWYNDSIATTPTRCIEGTLSLFDRRIILIAGGHDKKLPFDGLAQAICRRVRTLVLMGEASPKIEAAVLSCPEYRGSGLEICHAANMDEAVAIAASSARDGDIVSLSPACAAFDMYDNFEQRGRHYKELVNGLRPFAASRRRHDTADTDED